LVQFSWLSLRVTTELGGREPQKRRHASCWNTFFLTVTMYGMQLAATSNEGPCTIIAPPEPTTPPSKVEVAGSPTLGSSQPHRVRTHLGATEQPFPV
jgi:hypothetical protein